MNNSIKPHEFNAPYYLPNVTAKCRSLTVKYGEGKRAWIEGDRLVIYDLSLWLAKVWHVVSQWNPTRPTYNITTRDIPCMCHENTTHVLHDVTDVHVGSGELPQVGNNARWSLSVSVGVRFIRARALWFNWQLLKKTEKCSWEHTRVRIINRQLVSTTLLLFSTAVKKKWSW